MAELRSFRDVIENMFYNTIWDVVFSYVENNLNRLGCNSYHVSHPDEAELSDLTVKRVDILDSAGDEILFDVVVSAEIVIGETVKRNRETDDVEQWFRLSCKGDLNDGVKNFHISDINIYNKLNSSKTDRLTELLVPIIEKEQFDHVAEKFLKEFFPEALSVPMAVPAREVAARMGLTIKEKHLSRYFTLFGEIVFGDIQIEYYDRDSHEYKSLEVAKGTIFVDPDVYFMRNVGCWNNTVIHECVHWYKHRKYHELVKLYRPGAALISCQVDEINRYRGRKQWNPEDWMEWQANGIAPRILMPKSTSIQKIEELIRKNELLYGSENRLTIMENVLFELADFFEVSRIAAKIRMFDLGYQDVEGVFTYVDDHYIGNYAFSADSKKSDQTYCISLSDSFFEYFANPAFRQLIDSGNFIYIDSHYVINDPKYIKRTEYGGVDLTDYAKIHVDECCILFDLKVNESAKADIDVYLDSITFRKATPDYKRVPALNEGNHNLEIFMRSEELKKFHEEYAEEIHLLNVPVYDFVTTAWKHIERKGLDRKDFCAKTLMSEKAYDRIKTGKLSTPTLQTVMQLCVGLELGGVLGEQLLGLAGYKLNAQQLAYKKILYSYCGHSIYECDEVLIALGVQSIIPKQYRDSE